MTNRQDILDRDVVIDELRQTISEQENSIRSNEEDKRSINRNFLLKEENFKKDIEDLQTALSQAKHVIEKISVFKAAENDEMNSKNF